MTDGIGEKVNVTKVGSDGGRMEETMRPRVEQSDAGKITGRRRGVIEAISERQEKETRIIGRSFGERRRRRRRRGTEGDKGGGGIGN